MNRNNKFYTDYPFNEDGDHSAKLITLLLSDGDKYCKVLWKRNFYDVKAGYIWENAEDIGNFKKNFNIRNFRKFEVQENDLSKKRKLARSYYEKAKFSEGELDYENAELYYEKAIQMSPETDKYMYKYRKMLNNIFYK